MDQCTNIIILNNGQSEDWAHRSTTFRSCLARAFTIRPLAAFIFRHPPSALFHPLTKNKQVDGTPPSHIFTAYKHPSAGALKNSSNKLQEFLKPLNSTRLIVCLIVQCLHKDYLRQFCARWGALITSAAALADAELAFVRLWLFLEVRGGRNASAEVGGDVLLRRSFTCRAS